jgi:hypothetical protein
MFRATMEPDPTQIRRAFYDRLLKKLRETHADEVVVTKNVRSRWRKRYDDNDLVKIVTARDDLVCQMCRDMAAHNPYRYGDAKRALPHHWGCRCQIAALTARDDGYLRQPTFKKVQKFAKRFVKDSLKHKGKKVPQRGATIKKLRKKGRRFVAPSGYRVIIRARRGK